MKNRLILASACVAAAVAVGTPAASAAPQGQVEQGPQHARSICSYSGLNDTPDAEAPEGGQVQSYGQLVRQGLKAEFPSPGELCNPNNLPLK